MMRSIAKLSLVLVVTIVLAHHVTAQTTDPDAARERWQRVPDIFAAMGVHEGAIVADVGAGNGFLTVRLAPAVGATGKVYAIDIVPETIERLRERLAKSNIRNVEVLVGSRIPTALLPPASRECL